MKRESVRRFDLKENPIYIREENGVYWYNSIGFKILLYFLIPVVLIILIGLLSYGQASKIVTMKYMESTLEGIKMTSEYIKFGFSGIDAVSFELISNEEVENYYLGLYSRDGTESMESVNRYKSIQKQILIKRAANSFIYNIHILSNKYGLNTTDNLMNTELIESKNADRTVVYEAFMQQEGEQLLKNRKTGLWISDESVLDKMLNINYNEYGIRYARAFQNSESCIVIDVSTQAIKKVLKQLDYDEDCISAFVTAEGKEIISIQNLNSKEISVSEFIKDHIDEDVSSGSSKLIFKGKQYLFFYSRVGKTGATICSFITENSLTKQLNSIRLITFILILVSSMIAIFIAFKVRKLTRPIHFMMEQMERIEIGDFNIELSVESNDEIGILSKRFNQMSSELETYINQSYLAQIKQNEAEMTALKSQIYPHFLYNTLEVIRMTALNEGDEKVSNMIDALSSQIHYVIGPVGDLVPLEKEAEIVHKYVYLLNCRNNSNIELIMNLGHYGKIIVPKLILQPIVENAYIHGLKPHNNSGSILIEADVTEEFFEIVLMDNGIGMDEETLRALITFLDSNEIGIKNEYNWQSIGLKNVNDRLRYLYGNEYGLIISSTISVGTMVRIRLPLASTQE
ncbi:MAG: sensor histidine kinase [Anaerocolumna sp.]